MADRVTADSAAAASPATDASPEPTLDRASQWWPELPNKWTAVGWKDHLYRFNVLFNGTLMNFPVRQDRAGGQEPGAQFTFYPCDSPDLKVPYMSLAGLEPSHDSGFNQQGWTDNVAPVLWTTWLGYRQTSTLAIMRQEIFAHVTGGEAARRGTEPLFAWVRLSVAEECPPLPAPDSAGFAIKINAPFLRADMRRRYNIRYNLEKSQYARRLSTAQEAYDPRRGFTVQEESGLARLAVAPGQNCQAHFKPGTPTPRDHTLIVLMRGKKGSSVDLLIPFFPVAPAILERELALGYDGALAEANRFWSQVPSTAARFEVPERSLSRLIQRNLQTQEILGERDPATGNRSMVTGGWVYGHGLWPTPVSMSWTMLLDNMGYHSVLAKYLAMFKREQGTVVPPGGCYQLHPGYLSSPKSLTTIDWVTDHGAILNTIANHALLVGDADYTKEWMPVIEKACEWVQYARRLENHDGIKGVLPPAVANDVLGPEQAVWSDGWAYKGLTTAVRLMKRTGHPRYAEFAAEAREYREVFRGHLFDKLKSQPRWRDQDGGERTLVPRVLSGEDRYAWEGYLDTGPLFLVYAGLASADEPVMRDTMAWFRHGPTVQFHRRDADFTQPAILDHEMSSYEPCYSWNVFHSWQRGDRRLFLEGMYSLFAAAYSRQTFSVCEMRGGIAACVHWLPSVYFARLAVVDDQIREDELHLLRLVPLAWVRDGLPARFERIPTEYGPVDLRLEVQNGGKALDVRFSGASHYAPRRVVLHPVPLPGLTAVRVNGREFAPGREIEIGRA